MSQSWMVNQLVLIGYILTFNVFCILCLISTFALPYDWNRPWTNRGTGLSLSINIYRHHCPKALPAQIKKSASKNIHCRKLTYTEQQDLCLTLLLNNGDA